ncbi:MAG: NUDIX domain-containing protein, partial [Coleofasciculus sp. C2-GNP5-27]
MPEKNHAITYSDKDYEILEYKKGFDGFSSIDIYMLRFRNYDGSWSDVIEREIHNRGSAVAVILYDSDKDRVVLVEQFRPAAAVAKRPPWQLEIVAGMISGSDSTEIVARKEVREEAGCGKIELIPIYEYFPSPGASSDRTHLYCGLIDSDTLGGTHGIAEEGENTRVRIFDFLEVTDLLEQGRIENSTSIVAIQWLAL